MESKQMKISAKAYSEVYTIVNLLEDEYKNRVPKKIMDFFDEVRDKKFEVNIDIERSLLEQNIERQTLVILAILELNYWCDSEEEKQELLKEFAENERKQEEEIREKYNPDNLFKNIEAILPNKNEEQTALVEYKEEGFIKKIINKIKKLFKR